MPLGGSNPEFTEFLHTKGFKAKVRLIIANLKNGRREAQSKTATKIDRISAQTKVNIAQARANIYKTKAGFGAQSFNSKTQEASEFSADELTKAFNEFLNEKELALSALCYNTVRTYFNQIFHYVLTYAVYML